MIENIQSSLALMLSILIHLGIGLFTDPTQQYQNLNYNEPIPVKIASFGTMSPNIPIDSAQNYNEAQALSNAILAPKNTTNNKSTLVNSEAEQGVLTDPLIANLSNHQQVEQIQERNWQINSISELTEKAVAINHKQLPSSHIKEVSKKTEEKKKVVTEKHIAKETKSKPQKTLYHSEPSDTESTVYAHADKQLLANKNQISHPVNDTSTDITVANESIAVPFYHLIPKPPYPPQSRNRGEEGTVIVVVVVDKKGDVKQTSLSKSSGYLRLDESALKTVKEKWKFKPGIRNGIPIESRVRVPIKFNLRHY